MIIENRSHRTNIYSKTFHDVLDTNSFAFQRGRRLAYTQRLYFEYLYTQKVKGTTFFYTLTYNDAAIPHYFKDRPCFNYADIRIVTNGALSKDLERKYGSRLRYFVACETGEGKGSRGAGRNPHYHCIFFVQPIHDKDNKPIFDSYKAIQPLDFRRIIRRVWQGTENDYVNFNECKFGICKEGDNCGLVTGVAPFKYCSKYVLKDNNELALENEVINYWSNKVKTEDINLQVLWYFYKYNTLLCGEPCHYLFYDLGLDKYNRYRKLTIDSDKSYWRYIKRYASVDLKLIVNEYLNGFVNDYYKPMFVRAKLNEYRNLYSGKVRCSKGLGEYGLNFVKDADFNPTFNIPTPQGFDCQSISLYYYRKLYYDKYFCDVTGSVLYRLNERGKRLKINTLSNTIEKHSIKVKEALSVVFNNHFALFDKERSSKLINSLVDNPQRDEIIHRYSIYKTVYEFRFVDKSDFVALDPCFSMDSVKRDYSIFINNDSYFLDYNYVSRLYIRDYNARSFEYHPNFKCYMRLFSELDSMLEAVSRFRSENAKELFRFNSELMSKIKASRQ